MLSNWGYVYFDLGQGLGCIQLDLESYRKAAVVGVAPASPSTIRPHNPIIHALRGHLSNVEVRAAHQELGTIPRDAEILKAKIDQAAKRTAAQLLSTDEILSDVRRLRDDFLYILQKRKFYAISSESMRYYGQPELFGTRVAKKFKAATDDIERAGNCLALGEPTACVLHLNRAMEIALHRLAKRLHITPLATDNMGSILGKMTDPIKNLPDKTERQKRKKEMWAECRTNLYHVKMAWRDPGAHGKQDYDHKRASDILKRVGDFMQQLAGL
jgi:hypothetical protein